MSKGTYAPNYPDPTVEGDVLTLSGVLASENVRIEEAAQRAVAENLVWLLARKALWVRGKFFARGIDSCGELEALGFTVLKEHDDLFYEVDPPPGWSKSTDGYHTTVVDNTGQKRISQFFSGAWYDRRASLNVNS